jgi:hypothetical protein
MVLSEDGCVQQPSLRYNINTKIKDILSTMTMFGSVSIRYLSVLLPSKIYIL